ncbi:response regulator [Candidatus Saganbacteria bacterium]|nr:response regulator [Candidatus Saganbacteria bacterium]
MKPRILIVDDKVADCETVSDVLTQKKDYSCETAQTGAEALKKIKQMPFNAALVDIKLPDISGVDLLKEIKKLAPECEVIMATAYSLLEDAIRSLNLGAFSYLTKPFNPGELAVKIEKALEKQKMAEALKAEVEKLEAANALAVERELRMVEMKKELEALKAELKAKPA